MHPCCGAWETTSVYERYSATLRYTGPSLLYAPAPLTYIYKGERETIERCLGMTHVNHESRHSSSTWNNRYRNPMRLIAWEVDGDESLWTGMSCWGNVHKCHAVDTRWYLLPVNLLCWVWVLVKQKKENNEATSCRSSVQGLRSIISNPTLPSVMIAMFHVKHELLT